MFSWLFGKKAVPIVKKTYRAAQIYYRANDGILIATERTDVDGFSGPGEPMTRLAFNAPDIELGECCVQCLQASTGIGNLQKSELEAVIAPFFQLARVKGWNQLEKRWEYIRIYQDPFDNAIRIVPFERCRGGGYEGADDEHQFKCDLDVEQIGSYLRKLIDSNL